MKRVVTLLLAAGLFMGAVAPKAEAVEVKFSGYYEAVGRYIDNYSFTEGSVGQSNNAKFDQRFRVNMNFVVSEALSAFLRLETDNTWGSALGTVTAAQAYMQWLVPNTDVRIRMGYVSDEFDTYAMPTSLSGDGTAGVRINAPITDNVEIVAGWHRPSYAAPTATRHASYLDLFSLQVPLKFSTFAITPSLRFAMIGENIPFGAMTNPNAGKDFTSVAAALFPLGLGAPVAAAQVRGENSTAWWAGFTSQYTGFTPLTIAFDAYYGAQDTNIPGDSNILDRSGWFTALKVNYQFNFANLGAFAWYSTGDDRNPLNGSERMPSLGAGFNVAGRVAGGQDIVFAGTNTIGTAANAYGTPSGTWGLALGLSGISFLENLKHGVWVEYASGTNSSKMITDRPTLVSNAMVTPNRYLTNKDSIIQFGLINTYNIYKELELRLQLAYAIENFDKKTWIDSGALLDTTKWGNIFETELKLTYRF